MLVVLLVVAAFTDLKCGRIYNAVTYPAVAIALIGHTLAGGLHGQGQWFGLVGSLAGLAAGFVPLLIAWKAGGIGGGDAKVMAGIGALMGWKFALATLFYGFLAAAIMAIIVMIRKKVVVQTLTRMWRFVYLAFTPSKPAPPTAAESPKVAFGVALCFGAAAAIAEFLLTSNEPLSKILGIF